MTLTEPDWLKHSVIIIITLVMLSACKTTTKEQIDALPDNYSQLSNEEKLSMLTRWELSGKIAIISPKERQSAYLNWEQLEDQTDFKLTNLLGVSLLKLNADSQSASLEADGKLYEDESKEALIYRTTGWLLPLDNLIFWIKGASNEQDIIELNQQGLPRKISPSCFRCAGWQITYANYKQLDGLWLPHAITVANFDQETTLKFRVDEWLRK
ncbi:outer membrane lipoprotein LolB [Glaciecola sp. MH2013]|uniref:lipoprotein insertase outer membrane protein LolB n=1 Tax=Glaciecola sp. MH2013 TaxID=2785524 RepID=UPI00189C8082|nr:lipoprotein insertase outer membrane protein LolB [Glaciecola sp. MH2013]MBF7072561.1 outer membrane lipoprotein LolB [Glaciecola sp. MH2013]